MIKFWKSLAYTTRFSVIAFLATGTLGFISMGLLGFGLYYVVSFLFTSYPNIDSWHGDWVWPVMILAGMAWPFGFIFAGIMWHFLSKKIQSVALLRIIYVIVLWLWAALIWYLLIRSNVESL